MIGSSTLGIVGTQYPELNVKNNCIKSNFILPFNPFSIFICVKNIAKKILLYSRTCFHVYITLLKHYWFSPSFEPGSPSTRGPRGRTDWFPGPVLTSFGSLVAELGMLIRVFLP